MNKETILEAVKTGGVDFINLQFVDILGMVKAVTIPSSKLAEAIDNNVWFDGSSIQGFTRIFESDMFLKLDLATFAVLPWQKNTARIICDVYLPNGQPFPGDPRLALKKQLELAKQMDYTYNTGPELEFFLFKKTDDGSIAPLPHDNAGYFDLTTDLAQEIRQEMTIALKAFAIDVEALHHEVAVGQHEIDFKYADALTTADSAVTLRYVLKAIANKYNLHATFLPKPIEGINGSGMHVHQSLFVGDKNIFYQANDKYNLSEVAKNFIAGQLKHARGFAALTNPLVNSYKRLVPGYEAPVYISWAQTNRSAMVRIPRYTVGREQAVRCELRCPDPSANPYLAFAVMLAAALDGIKNKLVPPEPVEENIFQLSDDEAKRRGVGNLPENLLDALRELEKDEVVKTALGQHIYQQFVQAKTAEWDSYKTNVSKWEHDQYLEVY